MSARKKKRKPAPGFDRRKLKDELSDPRKFQKQIHRLHTLLKNEPVFRSLYFPPELFAECLDAFDNDEDFGTSESAYPEERDRILSHIYRRFLTPSRLVQVESTLLEYLRETKSKPSDLKAVAAGLFMLEYHRKNPADVLQNPLWELIFSVSYEQFSSGAGGAVREASGTATAKIPLPGPETMPDLDLTEGEVNLVREAIGHLESGTVELGFSLDSILLGLPVHGEPLRSEPPGAKIRYLLGTFAEEIGQREKDDLVWGLNFAISRSKGDRKRSFQSVLKGISRLPVHRNPVLFALYVKCVLEFYRFLKSDEIDAAHAILKALDDPDPILEYARFLFNREAPRRSLKAFEAAARLDPGNAAAAFGSGAALWMTGSFREARLQFHNAARRRESDSRIARLCRDMVDLEDDEPLPDDVLELFSRPFRDIA